MELQKEVWQDHIVGNLYKSNQFLNCAVNADEYVLAGAVVHMQNAGAGSAVTKNRSSFPATAVKRADTAITYALDEFTTDPVHIPNAETVELSFDKRQSVIREDSATLNQAVADNMLINWAPSTASAILRTTGADVAAHLPSATGNRKAFKLDDLENSAAILDGQDFPEEDRYAMFSAKMYRQLTAQLKGTDYRDFMAAMDPKTGVVGALFGFKILKRSTVLGYTNASTPVVKPYGATAAATDNDAIMCWHLSGVERALGEVRMFGNEDDATYYGDVYSFLLRMGGRKRYSDERGVVTIVQAASE